MSFKINKKMLLPVPTQLHVAKINSQTQEFSHSLNKIEKKTLLSSFIPFLCFNSIAALPSEDGSFVSVGEDRSLRIWKGMAPFFLFSFIKFNMTLYVTCNVQFKAANSQ